MPLSLTKPTCVGKRLRVDKGLQCLNVVQCIGIDLVIGVLNG